MNTILIKFVLFLIIFLIFLIVNMSLNKKNEKFENDKTYLYPTADLGKECVNMNLLPSFMPKACYTDGKLNPYANCKCEDKSGNCKICYDEIKKDSKNANVVYNANDIS